MWAQGVLTGLLTGKMRQEIVRLRPKDHASGPAMSARKRRQELLTGHLVWVLAAPVGENHEAELALRNHADVGRGVVGLISCATIRSTSPSVMARERSGGPEISAGMSASNANRMGFPINSARASHAHSKQASAG
jgi:hypothetical protein